MDTYKIYSDSKIINFKPNTVFSKDLSIFDKVDIRDKLNIRNFIQDNFEDFNLKKDKITNFVMPEIFNSKKIIALGNINLSSTNESIINVLNNEAITNVNNLILDDKFIESIYTVNEFLNIQKNLNILNEFKYTEFRKNVIIDNYDNLSLHIKQDFVVKNDLVCKAEFNLVLPGEIRKYSLK